MFDYEFAYTQKDIVRSILYYNYPQTPANIARVAGFPAPSVRRVLRELEDAKMARWVPADEAKNGVSGYVRV
jgi:hypothetical protein